MKNRQKNCLVWGDEVEYMVIVYDHETKNAKLALRAFEILKELQKEEDELNDNPNSGKVLETLWRPEYGAYMIEGTPGNPYGGTIKDLLKVEPNMKLRRLVVTKHLGQNETIVTVTSFPRLGCQGQFLEPHYEPHGNASRSLFVPDELINPHARFPTLTANIRKRRGSKVAINMPIFHDKNTPNPFIDPKITYDRNLFPEDKEAVEGAALPDHIYMDSMVFGMGCCCLQITFQACNIEEARRLYDQLAVIAAAPIYRGYLSDVDCRWDVIAGSVDDRTKEERGLEPLKNDRFVINKSRYDSIDCYISTDKTLKPEYNDLDLVYDEKIFKKLVDNGIDELLARHISHLFIRDPLVIFEELLDQDDNISSDHFENIQSTNWQTMRFKPPPPNSNIGWRVEFRSMEIQITDFENAAFAIFIVLLTRIILSYNLNFYIPISKVDENMRIAHNKDAVLNEKFWFRKNILENENSPILNNTSENTLYNTDNFMNESINVDIESRCMLGKYLRFVSKRAEGKLQTTAKWMRNFVQNHPKYNQDSVVTQEINYDLIRMIEKIQNGQVKVEELMDDCLQK
ncbi:5957_t:CDS:10 [Entrophospora sp. SA101]|nr:5957_t:CDS:10 [Entrophospora sp. SA101]